MRLPPDPVPGQLNERGVWKLAAMGPDGEFVFYAVTSERRMLRNSITFLPPNSDFETELERLWDRLDEADPVTAEAIDQVRRRRLRIVS